MKTKLARIPLEMFNEAEKLSKALNIPISKAFLFRDKLLTGDIELKYDKKTKEVIGFVVTIV